MVKKRTIIPKKWGQLSILFLFFFMSSGMIQLALKFVRHGLKYRGEIAEVTREQMREVPMGDVLLIVGAAIGSLGLFFVLASLFILLFVLYKEVVENNKNIGSALLFGYTGKEIFVMFVRRYLGTVLLGIMAGVVGAFLFFPFVYPLCTGGEYMEQVGEWDFAMVIAGVAIFLLFVALEFLYIRKKIREIDLTGISRHDDANEVYRREGRRPRKSSNKLMKNMRRKDLFFFRKYYIVTAALIMVAVIILGFFGTLCYNCVARSDVFQKNFLINPSDIDFAIESIDDRFVAEELATWEEIDKIIAFETMELKAEQRNVSVYVGDSLAWMESPHCYQGRVPHHGNEVAIGGALAQKLNKCPGDEIVFSGEDKEATYLITGLLQSADMGTNAEFTKEGILRLVPEYEEDCFSIYLNEKIEKSKIDPLIDRINQTYGRQLKEISNKWVDVDEMQRQYQNIICLISATLVGLMFILYIPLLNFFVRITFWRRRELFYHQQFIGFTRKEIYGQCCFNYLVTIIFGGVLGSVVSWLVNPVVAGKMFQMIGIMQARFDTGYLVFLFMAGALLLISLYPLLTIDIRLRKYLARGELWE